MDLWICLQTYKFACGEPVETLWTVEQPPTTYPQASTSLCSTINDPLVWSHLEAFLSEHVSSDVA